MTRSSLSKLGETELEVLNIMWDLGSASVSDVRERILENRDIAYTTVMTVMRKLADKGYLSFTEDGKSYLYSPEIPADKVRGSLLSDLVMRVFRGSHKELVRTLVEEESLSGEEIAELRRLIDNLEDRDD
ncbi:MAG: BlaI/MecI/CopY family transcriptional regulator [Rhodothermales bacterium]|nr:BlaI/MecI/CopY family transcriptional regulator [Rhodothermales bacterium]